MTFDYDLFVMGAGSGGDDEWPNSAASICNEVAIGCLK